MSYTSDLEHWRIEAKATYDYVEEIHIISDPARVIRAQRTTRKWEVLKTLGRGGFGEVRLESHGQRQRALKRIWTADTRLNDADYERELKALLEFSKPRYKAAACFVEFYGWFPYGRDVFLAMEYVPLGDLDKVLGQSKVVETEARDIGLQILTGLNIMHLESFAHRDLKPGNVLVVHGRPDWWVKLADFGMSKRLTGSTVLDTRGGTVSYMAPEVRLCPPMPSSAANTEYTNLIDLWALGCIVFRLITGTILFPHDGVFNDYYNDKIPFPEKELVGLSSIGVEFVRQLLQVNPSKRISSSEALKHPWITANGDRRSSIVDQPAPNLESENNDDCIQYEATTEQENSSSQSSLMSSRFSEDYKSVSHAGLKSLNYLSQSYTSQSETSTTIVPHLKDENKETQINATDHADIRRTTVVLRLKDEEQEVQPTANNHADIRYTTIVPRLGDEIKKAQPTPNEMEGTDQTAVLPRVKDENTEAQQTTVLPRLQVEYKEAQSTANSFSETQHSRSEIRKWADEGLGLGLKNPFDGSIAYELEVPPLSDVREWADASFGLGLKSAVDGSIAYELQAPRYMALKEQGQSNQILQRNIPKITAKFQDEIAAGQLQLLAMREFSARSQGSHYYQDWDNYPTTSYRAFKHHRASPDQDGEIEDERRMEHPPSSPAQKLMRRNAIVGYGELSSSRSSLGLTPKSPTATPCHNPLGIMRFAAYDYNPEPETGRLRFTKGTLIYDITPVQGTPRWLHGVSYVSGETGRFPEWYLSEEDSLLPTQPTSGVVNAMLPENLHEREELLRREEEKLREMEVKVQREINEKRQELLEKESIIRELEARILQEPNAQPEMTRSVDLETMAGNNAIGGVWGTLAPPGFYPESTAVKPKASFRNLLSKSFGRS